MKDVSDGVCGKYGEEKKYVQELMEKPDGNIPLGTPTGKWEDNNKMVKVKFTL